MKKILLAASALAISAVAMAAPTTWQASMVLTAATSTTLTLANVTMGPSSGPLPSSFGVVTIINAGSNPVSVCFFGGTCSTSGSEVIQAGACDTVDIVPASVPSLYSTAGTTLSLRGGTGC